MPAPLPDLSCCGHRVEILDSYGRTALLFVRRCDGNYFGGTTAPDPDLFYGPHVVLQLGGILDLLARLARQHEDDRIGPMRIRTAGSVVFEDEAIRRHMSAPKLATILGCTEKQVRDHLEPLVKLA